MKHTIYALTMFALAACTSPQEEAIDRHALVTRNNPEVTAMDSLSSLSVGNGEFAYTVDATGLQTFPEVILHQGFLRFIVFGISEAVPSPLALCTQWNSVFIDFGKSLQSCSIYRVGKFSVSYRQGG